MYGLKFPLWGYFRLASRCPLAILGSPRSSLRPSRRVVRHYGAGIAASAQAGGPQQLAVGPVPPQVRLLESATQWQCAALYR